MARAFLYGADRSLPPSRDTPMTERPYDPARKSAPGGARPGGAWARRGWLATTLFLAAAVVLSSWGNFSAARAAVDTLNTGQAEILENAVRSAEPRGGFEGEIPALQAVLESHREGGLRYIGLLDSSGKVTGSVGRTRDPIALPAQLQRGARVTGSVVVSTGDHVRVFAFRGGGRGGGPPGGSPPRDTSRAGGAGGPTPDARGFQRGGPPRPSFYLLEFDPVPAYNVLVRAVNSLIVSAVVAGVLTLAALAFWRRSLQEEAMREHLEQQKRLSQLGEMSAVLAHEIRNPLASLKGNAQLLAEGLETGSRERRRADRVVAEAIRLENLTSDLLDFARSAPLLRRQVSPVELLRTAADEVASGGVRVEAEGAPDLWPVDASRLRQALVNLLRNAVQMSPEGRPPVARVAEQGGRLVFTVRDFGPGLDASARERVFEPFFTTRTNGTGLGLPVARRAVELHGGTLDVDNHPEGGAVFRIVLPGGGN
jgi:two-component system sensor histidine kinase HydH